MRLFYILAATACTNGKISSGNTQNSDSSTYGSNPSTGHNDTSPESDDQTTETDEGDVVQGEGPSEFESDTGGFGTGGDDPSEPILSEQFLHR